MNGMFEKVANYPLVHIRNDLLYNFRLISPEWLNEQIREFDYAISEKSTKIQIVNEDDVIRK